MVKCRANTQFHKSITTNVFIRLYHMFYVISNISSPSRLVSWLRRACISAHLASMHLHPSGCVSLTGSNDTTLIAYCLLISETTDPFISVDLSRLISHPITSSSSTLHGSISTSIQKAIMIFETQSYSNSVLFKYTLLFTHAILYNNLLPLFSDVFASIAAKFSVTMTVCFQ